MWGDIMREFYLMNKDNIIVHFGVKRDALGVNYVALSDLRGSLPLDFTSLHDWIQSRYIMSYRTHIENLFKSLGIFNIEDYMTITHCIAITDTFWIKETSQRLKWHNVSPYRNPLNKAISEYSFTGKVDGISITSSPDFSTDGNYPKCWRKVNNELRLYKAGTSGAINAGYEPYSEVFAYQLSKYLNFDSVEYKLGSYKNKDVSICRCMCSEDLGLYSMKMLNNGITDYKYLLDYAKALGQTDYKRVLDMLTLDVLLCNTDRHFGNIGLFFNTDLNQVLRISRIYDNNLSCIPYYTKDEDLIYYINDIRAKDGSTFKELYKLIRCQYTDSVVERAKNFKFKRIGNERANSRIGILNAMLNYQVNSCLSVS
jgi:hypothetical protein